MNERVKVFTYVSGEGSTLLEAGLEERINKWLSETPGKVLRITQSESDRPGAAQHVTVCVWYVPEDPA